MCADYRPRQQLDSACRQALERSACRRRRPFAAQRYDLLCREFYGEPIRVDPGLSAAEAPLPLTSARRPHRLLRSVARGVFAGAVFALMLPFLSTIFHLSYDASSLCLQHLSCRFWAYANDFWNVD